MDKFANDLAARWSNGRTAGFNRGLRTIPWRAGGMTHFGHFGHFRHFRHFRLRILHIFG